jgi:predicted nucleic acid-binding protein
VKKSVVTDSACLIGLERIGRLDVLPALFDPIIIPPEVQREFGGSLDWLQVRVPNNQALVNALKLVVDDGEAEAIALAYERHDLLILDDRQARSVAQRLPVPIIGTIGVLLLAKQAGILTSVASILIELESASFYVSDALKEEALRLAGE